jgi:hypothetical protein
MEGYSGPEDDMFPGGFSWAKEHGYGHEMYNHKSYRGYCCGMAPVKAGTIDISKLGASRGDQQIAGILVVWTAPHPDADGRFVVGWYRNATVYRKAQPGGAWRTHDGAVLPYNARAASAACHLLASADRLFAVPGGRGIKGEPGQAAAYFVPSGSRLESELLAYVNRRTLPRRRIMRTARSGGLQTRVPDAAHNKCVEVAAMEYVKERYREWDIDDVCILNRGWDIEVRKGDKRLCLEVKGVSRSAVSVEVTPNEYAQMVLVEAEKFTHGGYRLCVVTNVLRANPKYFEFQYRGVRKRGSWIDMITGKRLKVKLLTAARLSD